MKKLLLFLVVPAIGWSQIGGSIFNPTSGGTVSTVGFTGGLISVGTPTTTPAFTVAGTSGGVPYFSSSSTWASSGALTANGVVVGGGAGAAPSSSAQFTVANLGTAGTEQWVLVNPGLTTTPTGGFSLQNTTPSTVSVTDQWSAPINFLAHVWKSNATAADQTVQFNQFLATRSRGAAGMAELRFVPTLNGTPAAGVAFCSGGAGAVQVGTYIVGVDGSGAYNCDNSVGFAGIGPVGANNVFGFYTNAGVRFNVNNNGIVMPNTSSIAWASGGIAGEITGDVTIGRFAAATLQHGAADAAAPVAQSIRFQSVVAGTSNTAGVDATFKASAGTGTGVGGKFIFQVAPAGSTGTAQNALSTILTLAADANLTATFAGIIVRKGYTVSTLPSSPGTGAFAYVTDAVACTFLATLTGGGSAYCPVGYNGSAWVAD